jgi:hypothetical protein
MATDPTEKAFVWDDSDDDSLVIASPEETRDEDAKQRKPRQNPGLLAVFGGLYAIWSVAWVLGVVAAPTQPASSLLDAVMYQFGEFLAIIATPVWFGAIWWLTDSTRRVFRVLWLVLGLVVLVPLPLILPVLLT